MVSVIFPGNAVNFPDFPRDERWAAIPRNWYGLAKGYADLTSVAASEFQLLAPSHQRDVKDKEIVLPAGVTIYYIGIRLPLRAEAGKERMPGMLEQGATLIGVTGENLKVASAHTSTAPVITCANNAYTSDATASSAATPWTTLAAPLGTLGVATTFKILVSNAGNTAAGAGGIRTSKGTARIYAEIAYCEPSPVGNFEQMGYPSPYQPRE